MTDSRDELIKLYAEVERLRAELKRAVGVIENIAKKRPHDVSQNEAADMACEFSLGARAFLKEVKS